MDDVLATIANQPANAAEPVAQTQETGSQVSDAGGAQTSQPAGAGGNQGFAPSSGQLPTPEAVQSSPPQAPQISEADYRAAQQEAMQFRQLQAELQALARERQAEAQRQAEHTRLAQTREQIRQMAANMPPEDALTYIDRQYDQLLAEQEGRRMQEMYQQQQQFMATLTEATRPAYAHHLAQTHQLPAEYEQRLMMLPPQQMDQYLPVLKQEYAAAKQQQDNYQRLMQEMDQIRRSQGANGLAQNGAHNVGGVGGQPIVIDTDKLEKGTPEHLLSLAGEMFGFNRG